MTIPATPSLAPARVARGLAVETTQCAVSVFCLVFGSLMLVAPHALQLAVYQPLQAGLAGWGVLFTLAGAVLPLATFRIVGTFWYRPIHLPALLSLLIMAWLGWTNGQGAHILVYGVLSLSLAYAAWQPRSSLQPATTSLLALTFGVLGIISGVTMLSQPNLLRTTLYDYTTWQPALGLGLVVTGALVLATQIYPSRFRAAEIPARLGLASLLLTVLLAVILPFRGWATSAFMLSFVPLLVLEPWVAARVRGAIGSFRARLALILAAAAALPLIATVALVSHQQDSLERDVALMHEANAAQGIAHDVHRYLSLHLAAITTLANQPDLLSLTPPEQFQRLRATHMAFPDFYTVGLFDADGRQLARTDGRPLLDIGPSGPARDSFERQRAMRLPEVYLTWSVSISHPVLALVGPIVDAQGVFRGRVIGGPTAEQFAALLHSTDFRIPGRTVTIVDGQGRALTHATAQQLLEGSDLSHLPPVQAVLQNGVVGSFVYGTGRNEQLAGLARVPVTGWGVIVERPVAVVLDSTRTGREATFALLWLAIGLSVLGGYLLAGRSVRPLRRLAEAATQFGRGLDVALPTSRTHETATLIHEFHRMREHVRGRERDLHESEARYRALFDHNPATVLLIDLETLRILDVNEAALVTYGYTREEFLALPLQDLQAAESRPGFEERVRQSSREFPVLRRPLRHCCKDGQVLDVELSWRTVEVDGRPCRLVVAHDVTDRVEAQAREQAAREQAEQALALREEFFNIAAHELKTPITVLRGHAQLQLHRLEREPTTDRARTQAAFTLIVEQTRKLQRMVEELLDLHRLESGRLELELTDTDLVSLARETVASSRLRAGSREIQLNATVAVRARVDALRLEQVIANLLDNALKYSPVDQPILVTLAMADGERNAGTLEISVRDYGRGIPPGDEERIFLRHQQVHPNDHVKGFGLGLFLCRQIVELHGGTIRVESPDNGGCCFIIDLPLQRSALTSVAE
ncbi:MAG: ATP-binding protein [Chloroflexota bacterium]